MELPCGEKLQQYFKQFPQNTGMQRMERQTDRQTELLYQHRMSVC